MASDEAIKSLYVCYIVSVTCFFRADILVTGSWSATPVEDMVRSATFLNHIAKRMIIQLLDKVGAIGQMPCLVQVIVVVSHYLARDDIVFTTTANPRELGYRN